MRVNKVDGVPDDNGGKGGWWTVQMGVFDEGRPGRKSKGKKRNSGDAIESMVDAEGDGEGEGDDGEENQLGIEKIAMEGEIKGDMTFSSEKRGMMIQDQGTPMAMGMIS